MCSSYISLLNLRAKSCFAGAICTNNNELFKLQLWICVGIPKFGWQLNLHLDAKTMIDA
jgi:hypothetical protein